VLLSSRLAGTLSGVVAAVLGMIGTIAWKMSATHGMIGAHVVSLAMYAAACWIIIALCHSLGNMQQRINEFSNTLESKVKDRTSYLEAMSHEFVR
jgi:hypothetical protein